MQMKVTYTDAPMPTARANNTRGDDKVFTVKELCVIVLEFIAFAVCFGMIGFILTIIAFN